MPLPFVLRIPAHLIFLAIASICLAATAHAQPLVNQTGQLPVRINGPVEMKFAIVEVETNPSPAYAKASVVRGAVAGLTLTQAGDGYQTVPQITLVAPRGSGARARATIANGRITGLQVIAGGQGYTQPPEVRIARPTGRFEVTTLWSNDGTSVAGGQPAQAVTLNVVRGTYSALLGYTGLPNMTPLPAAVLAHLDARLRVWYRNASGAFIRVLVDAPLQSTPYADTSAFAAGVANGSITAESLAAGAVTAEKLGADTVATGVGDKEAIIKQLGLVEAATPTQRAIDREVWLSVRTDGKAGTGTAEDPFDVSTSFKLDNLLQSFGTYTAIRFAPGTYLTKGSSYLQRVVLSSVATGASSSVVTTGSAHGLVTGQRIYLDGIIGGTPSLEGVSYAVTVLTSTTFSIPVAVTVAPTLGTYPFVYWRWYPKEGWKMRGAGMDQTVIQLADIGLNTHHVIGGDGYNRSDNFECEDLTVDVNVQNQSVKGVTGGITTQGKNCHVRRCKVINWGAGNGMESFLILIGSIGTNPYGVTAFNSDNCSVEDCVIGPHATGQTFLSGVSGIYLGGTGGDTPSGLAHNLTISGNYVSDITSGGANQPTYFHAYGMSQVAGGMITRNATFNLLGTNNAGVYMDTFVIQSVTVSDNTLWNVHQGINYVTDSLTENPCIERNVVGVADLRSALGIQVSAPTATHTGLIVRGNHVLPASTSVNALLGINLFRQQKMTVEGNCVETAVANNGMQTSGPGTSFASWQNNRTANGTLLLPLNNLAGNTIHSAYANVLNGTSLSVSGAGSFGSLTSSSLSAGSGGGLSLGANAYLVDIATGLRMTASADAFTTYGSLDMGFAGGDVTVRTSGSAGNEGINLIPDGSGAVRINGTPVMTGSGTPEGVKIATVGALYLRTDGGAGTTLYVKESGTGCTGWVAK